MLPVTRKISGIFFIIFISTTIVASFEGSAAAHQGSPEFNVWWGVINGPITIENSGNATANNVTWSVVIHGGFYGFIRRHYSGTNETFEPGAHIVVYPQMLGFGPSEITILANASNAEGFSQTLHSFTFLFLSMIVP